jgi:DNA-binding response OmpR family regulator
MFVNPSLHILIVEDNDSLREATVDFLMAHGHHVTGVVCAEEVDDTPTRDLPDLYIIDVNLPGENGFSLAQRIRRSHALVGIVLMTARGQTMDRIEGYAAGADNYLIKPVEQAELLACVNNLARRLKSSQVRKDQELELNLQTLCLQGPLGEVVLSHSECLLLAAFSRAAGQKLERWQAMQLVDTKDKGLVAANLEMRISALRKKLRAAGAPTTCIHTIRGFGYALVCKVNLV